MEEMEQQRRSEGLRSLAADFMNRHRSNNLSHEMDSHPRLQDSDNLKCGKPRICEVYCLRKNKNKNKNKKKTTTKLIIPDNCPRNAPPPDYGNLPGYMVSLLEKMPAWRPLEDRPCRKYLLNFSPSELLMIDNAAKPVVRPDDVFECYENPVKTRRRSPEEINVANKRLAEVVERKEDLDEYMLSIYEETKESSEDYAAAALSYLREKGESLELVKPCLFEFGAITMGARVHVNFQAKRTDIPSAPVETYFAQLRYYGPYCRDNIFVECCVSLGESDLLPYERDTRGCQYCSGFVHHPVNPCEGMIWGYQRWSEQRQSHVTL